MRHGKSSFNNKTSSRSARHDVSSVTPYRMFDSNPLHAHSVVIRLERFGARYRSWQAQSLLSAGYTHGPHALVDASVDAPTVTPMFACAWNDQLPAELFQYPGWDANVTDATCRLSVPFIPWRAFKC